METEDNYQHIANSQNFETPKQVMEAVRGKEDRPPHTVKYKSTTEYYTHEEGEAALLEIILNEATVSNKHKKNKSSEGIIENSTKTGGKGKKGKVTSLLNLSQDGKQENLRRMLWEELTRISHHNAPWLVGGDFNVILYPNENQGGDLRRMGPMDDFNEMMIDTGLVDAGFEGDPSPGPIKEFGKDWIECYTPKNGLRPSTLLGFCTFQDGCQIITPSSLMPLKLRTNGHLPSDSRICG
ncbi:UNVERIFIED_CONTAM: hypothetical protein Sangu_2773200 [Sesamum angustifolium]|uniref:Uncharacterized protein n=1 Tax=Sesamum angustifolium TaxID=2727405 RepID=A0AAW2ITV2_9LAMI